MKISKSTMIVQSLMLVILSFVSGALINTSTPLGILSLLLLLLAVLVIGHIVYLIKAYHNIPKEDLNIESVEDHRQFLIQNYDL